MNTIEFQTEKLPTGITEEEISKTAGKNYYKDMEYKITNTVNNNDDTIGEELQSIDKSTYLQTVGLLTLAKNHYEKLKDIEKTLMSLLNLSNYREECFVSDAIYGDENFSADDLLEVLDIDVRE